MNQQNNSTTETTKIALFKGKQIRKTIHNNEWWFSVVDVIEALTDSDRPSVYWTAMKARVNSYDGFQLSTICRQLKLLAEDGKMRETDCANSKGVLKLKADAKAGGDIAGGARKKLEKRLGRSVITKKNFLPRRQADKKRLTGG